MYTPPPKERNVSSNLTLRLDAEIINRVRHLAVDQNTSVSAWVRDLVLEKLHELDGFEPARQRALHAMAQPAEVSDAAMLSREQAHER